MQLVVQPPKYQNQRISPSSSVGKPCFLTKSRCPRDSHHQVCLQNIGNIFSRIYCPLSHVLAPMIKAAIGTFCCSLTRAQQCLGCRATHWYLSSAAPIYKFNARTVHVQSETAGDRYLPLWTFWLAQEAFSYVKHNLC